MLSDSRIGISLSEDELRHIDDIVSPLILQGQSPHHICTNNKDTLMISERSLYRLIDSGLITAKNIDLPRKVRYRSRKKKTALKVDKKCRIGRTFDLFLKYMDEHPDIPVSQIDSVEGTKGGKVLLTIHFVKAEFMLAFLRDYNDSRSVTNIFNSLDTLIGRRHFEDIFQVILTDNGSEFSDPSAIECDENGEIRTRLYYCDPQASWQKGSAERNHEFIRDFIPKGTPFEPFTQADISLMMDHINSYKRESLNNRSPYEMFRFFYGSEILDLLGCHLIPPQNVTLNRSIFRKEGESK
jgi:IS30 family transposase